MPQSAEVGEARQWAAFVGRDDLVHYPSAQDAGNRQAPKKSKPCLRNRAVECCFSVSCQLTHSHNAPCVYNMEADQPAEATLLVLASQAGQLCLRWLGPDGEYVLFDPAKHDANRY